MDFPKKAEAGYRWHGVSDASFYKRRSKFGGIEVSDAERLESMQQQNARLKRPLAEVMLHKDAPEAALRKILAPQVKR